MSFARVEPSYILKDGCRLVWRGVDEDDEDAIILRKEELGQLIDILKTNSTGGVELEDQISNIFVNSDVTQFNIRDQGTLEVSTSILQNKMLEYAKVSHKPQRVRFSSMEFHHVYESEEESMKADSIRLVLSIDPFFK
jgi:hypothetical protein